jgi:hypothetical protein
MNDVGTMTIANGNIPAFNIPALAANFNFDAVSTPLSFHGAGIAVCDTTNVVNCAAGQATFVGDITNEVDAGNVLPDGFVYTFDGTGGDNPGSGFDAIGVFAINGFLPVNVPAGNPVTASSDPTAFFDSRQEVLRNFLIDVTFAEVSVPGTIAFLGKSAIPGALPTNIAVEPEVSIFVDIVTGGGLAFESPVDLCVHYDDVDADGVVDGTNVEVITLKLLHGLALGPNNFQFEDVTKSVGGGVLCGQVGSLSPFLVATGPALTTTTTSTTVTTTTSTSFTTITTTSTTTSTSTTTLITGSCANALLCIEAALGGPPCGAEVLPTKLQNAYTKKLGKGATLIEKAGTATKLSKALKSVAKARKQVDKVGVKAEKFLTHKKTPISAECGGLIADVVGVILTAIDEGRLGVTLPPS